MNKSGNIQWLKRDELMPIAISKIQPVLIGFDIGTGIVPHDYLKTVIYVCCEPYEEYVKVLTEKISSDEIKTYVIQHKDWEESISNLEDKSIDSVYLIDVIEHLHKKDGIRLLKMAERVVRKQIVVFTPLGLIKQEVLEGGKDAWGLSGAEYQEHKSGWMPEDFNETWNIYACENFHNFNNIGNELETPFGAFWAIKNFNNTINSSIHSLPLEITDALFQHFPNKYFEIVEKLKQESLQHHQLQIEQAQLKNKMQQLQFEYAKLQTTFHHLASCKAVRIGNMVNRYFKKFGIK